MKFSSQTFCKRTAKSRGAEGRFNKKRGSKKKRTHSQEKDKSQFLTCSNFSEIILVCLHVDNLGELWANDSKVGMSEGRGEAWLLVVFPSFATSSTSQEEELTFVIWLKVRLTHLQPGSDLTPIIVPYSSPP